MAEFAGKPNLNFLEIGSFEGRSAVWMLENVLTGEDSFLTCIDTFKGGEDQKAMDLSSLEATFQANIEPWRNRVIVLRGESQSGLRCLHHGIDSFDFIYVDGSHVAEDVILDGILAWQLLKPKGIITFDDYLWNGPEDPRLCPRTGVDAFLMTRRPGTMQVMSVGVQVFVRKLA